jgi:hypothetical protein
MRPESADVGCTSAFSRRVDPESNVRPLAYLDDSGER